MRIGLPAISSFRRVLCSVACGVNRCEILPTELKKGRTIRS